MKIVLLDGATLNRGDLSWAPLQALGDCTIYDRTVPSEVFERSAGADVLLINKTVLTRETIMALPSLKYIGVLATGFNVVDVGAAKVRGIPVTNVPTYSTASVTQMVFAHLLHLLHNVGGHAEGVRRGRWTASRDFSYSDQQLHELTGMTMGILGLGRIGTTTARLGQAFGMRVIAYDPAAKRVEGVEPVGLEELFRRSDILTLHAPLTDETRHIVNAARLSLMKPTALLINTSRGQLVDEAALASALREERIAGAGLDVLSVEPPPADNPLLHAPNCHITPHIAWATREARIRLLDEVVENLRSWLAGQPRNVVSH